MKKNDLAIVKECVARLSQPDLDAIAIKFALGHKSDAAELLAVNETVSKIMGSTSDADEFFVMMEELEKTIFAEQRKRRTE